MSGNILYVYTHTHIHTHTHTHTHTEAYLGDIAGLVPDLSMKENTAIKQVT